ncbi:YciI family protein [Paraburkholderia oxyphila]|uniref:YciI family protein n=1 Tax=Paraburkholderia oxyphila TaxID=614212 RepID=UPI0004871B0B|nr:YciI family protein [Paraburkholderia oxyphila]
MLFLIYRKDKPGNLQVRLDNYAEHLAYLTHFGQKIQLGGPTLGPGTGTGDSDMTGSFLIFEAEDWNEVEAFVANDPFTQAGLFSATIIERWKHGKHNDMVK